MPVLVVVAGCLQGFFCQTGELDLVCQNTHRRGPSLCLRRRSIICPCGSVFLVQGFMSMVAVMVMLVRMLLRMCVSMVVAVAVTITVIVIVI